ncbi:MAG: hypothetical protein WCV90_08450 [Candidatus Woesearchaeota archaeon]|jgi:hypothetical protein
MVYTIHGKEITYAGGECGLYKQHELLFDYAVMDPDMLIAVINRMDKPTAIKSVTELREIVSGQVGLSEAPANIGSPVLRSTGHNQVPIEEVRPYLQNLVDFTDQVLNALQGK